MATSTIYFNRSGTITLDIGTVDFAHYAKVTLKIGNTVIHTSDKLPKSQDYYEWNASEAEKAQIISLMSATSKSVAGKMIRDVFWVVNDSEANLYDKEFDVTFVLEETEATKPTGAVEDKYPLIFTEYVQSKSKFGCVIDASAKNGAYVKTVAVTAAGVSCSLISSENGKYAFESGLLYGSGTRNVVITITDSRGFKKTINDSIYIYPYVPPTLTPLSSESGVVCKRWRPDTLTIDEMHGTECRIAVSVSSTFVPNVLTSYSIYYRYRATGGDTWSDEVFIDTRTVAKTGSSDFIAIITDGTAADESGVLIGKFNTETEYDIEIKVVDALDGTHTRYEQLMCQETSFNIKRNGLGVSAGKYATRDKCFDSAWDIHSDESIQADGDIEAGGKVAGASVEAIILVIDGKEIKVTADEINSLKGIQGEVQMRLTQISNSANATASNLQHNYYNKTAVDSLINSINSRLEKLEG